MLLSKSFIPILKDNPSEAKIKSHQLMLVKGFFPVFSFENFLQAILSASIKLCSCCLLPTLYDRVIFSISYSKP